MSISFKYKTNAHYLTFYAAFYMWNTIFTSAYIANPFFHVKAIYFAFIFRLCGNLGCCVERIKLTTHIYWCCWYDTSDLSYVPCHVMCRHRQQVSDTAKVVYVYNMH